MNKSDRVIGYISLLALLALFAGIAYGMFEAHEHVTYKAYVDFDELGSLQPEDPVAPAWKSSSTSPAPSARARSSTT